MLLFNKYIEELGYTKDSFPFKVVDRRYRLNKKYGVIEAQTWDLHMTIVLELYTYLRNFQENFMKYGTPMEFSDKPNGDKKWHKIVGEMVEGLEAYVEAHDLYSGDFNDWESYQKAIKAHYTKFDKAWKLIGKYIGDLWW